MDVCVSDMAHVKMEKDKEQEKKTTTTKRYQVIELRRNTRSSHK